MWICNQMLVWEVTDLLFHVSVDPVRKKAHLLQFENGKTKNIVKTSSGEMLPPD